MIVTLHPEVSSSVTINVARTAEEAERQAAGEDVTIEQIDDEDVDVNVEEVFEEGVTVDLQADAELKKLLKKLLKKHLKQTAPKRMC